MGRPEITKLEWLHKSTTGVSSLAGLMIRVIINQRTGYVRELYVDPPSGELIYVDMAYVDDTQGLIRLLRAKHDAREW